MAPINGISRRDFVKGAGGLLIGFSLANTNIAPQLLASPASEADIPPLPNHLDAWLRIETDGRVRVFTGKVDDGMGVATGFSQIVAEELDMEPANVLFVMGDTDLTIDQGGGGSSIMLGAQPLRNAAATTRYLLAQLASRRLGAPMELIQFKNSVISVKGDDSKRISFGALAGGIDLNDVMTVSGEGFDLNIAGTGKPKGPSTYTIVGKPLHRLDTPAKLYGKWQYVTDVRVPGMLHGRVVRPTCAGAMLMKVDESSVRGIFGYLQTVVKGNFVGVIAENEWAAIQAAKKLIVNWSAPAPAFPEQKDLYKHMRDVPPKATKETLNQGDTPAALSTAAKKLAATYEFPFQSHATMGPGCAVADVRMDGATTVWCGAQNSHDLQKGVAELLHIPVDKVRVIWVEDAASYGRPGFEDAAADAALLSQAAGKPVRVQWMRNDMTSWGTKGPAVVCDMAAGINANGEVTAVQFTSRAFSGGDILYRPDTAGNFLAGQLAGTPNKSTIDEFAQWGVQGVPYTFPNIHAVAHVVPPLQETASPLRTTHLRDPEGPATSFAVESFMDELAAFAHMDPVEFRMKHLDDARAKAILTATADKAGWNKLQSHKRIHSTAEITTGRGIALAIRAGTYVGTIAEVEVNRHSGAIRVTRLVCAHDCGLIINPEALQATIAGNLIQSLSRALKEEVMFDRSTVTSVDWKTYPVALAADIPAQVDIVLVNHPEIAATGAGEPSSRSTAAAIGNAIFDATGARVRQAPFTPERIRAAIALVAS